MSKIDEKIGSEDKQKFLAKAAIEDWIEKYGTKVDNNEYGVIFEGFWIPRWKPWIEFSQTSAPTLLTPDRLFMIYQYMMNTDVKGKFYECGVYRGAVTEMALGLGFDCVAFDTFEGIVGADPDLDVHENGQYKVDKEEVFKRIEGAEIVEGDVQETLRKRSDKVAMAHIDLDVYGPTLAALDLIYPMLASGGTIIVDDYGMAFCEGVKQACDDFGQGRKTYLPTGQLVIQVPTK